MSLLERIVALKTCGEKFLTGKSLDDFPLKFVRRTISNHHHYNEDNPTILRPHNYSHPPTDLAVPVHGCTLTGQHVPGKNTRQYVPGWEKSSSEMKSRIRICLARYLSIAC